MQHFKTIHNYCQAIGIAAPNHAEFDIRRFEDNMATVVSEMPAFRHEFYAVALKLVGSGVAITGVHENAIEGSSVFFNSPFQTMSWDIAPDWKGYYIMFSRDFMAQSLFLQDILKHFPFLKMESAIPFEVSEAEVPKFKALYEAILEEYHQTSPDKFELIEAQVLQLLSLAKRCFNQNVNPSVAKEGIRKTDIKLLSRFKTLIETRFQGHHTEQHSKSIHSTRCYAEVLGIHPNHLNAVVKQISGLTAKQHIQHYVLHLAKTKLIHSSESIKEIAYALHFESPNNFTKFFKKHTSKTPNAYRKTISL